MHLTNNSGSDEASLDIFVDLGSKRFHRRTIHAVVGAGRCQWLVIPARAARDGEKHILSSSTTRTPRSSWAPEIAMLSRSSSNMSASMSCLGRRSHRWAQTAALRALVRRYAEEGARGTAVLVVRREGVHADTPVEPIASLRRPGPCIEAHETRRRPFYATVSTNGEECG